MTINELRTEIQAAIAANGVQAITGDVLQKILLDMVGVFAAEGTVTETVPIYDFWVAYDETATPSLTVTCDKTADEIVRELNGEGFGPVFPGATSIPLAYARLLVQDDDIPGVETGEGVFFAPLYILQSAADVVAVFVLPDSDASHYDGVNVRVLYNVGRGWVLRRAEFLSY